MGESVEVLGETKRERWSNLMVRIAQGDEEAFEKLYSETNAAVFGFALRILNDRAEAEEVTIDVFLKVWEQAARFSPDRGSVLTWLLVITRSKALGRIRYKSVRLPNWLALDEVQLAAHPGTGPDSMTELSIITTKIARVLSDLPQAHRDAVEMALYEGMSHSEIAERLDQPIGTVKSRIRSAMIKIRGEVRVP
ncbi:MAG: sigma-70 family RNA polymerase sigma factor [Acidobacteria bacterium]|nr:sigma-70 family RNA polymerase sigma factor [Acidobacteriota bacterium]